MTLDLLRRAYNDIGQAIEQLSQVGVAPTVAQIDSRSQNAKLHAVNNDGKVTAMYVTVHFTQNAVYRCSFVRLIDEIEAQGKPIAYVLVEDKNNNPVQDATIVLATGYHGEILFDSAIPVRNDKQPREIVIGTSFVPPNLGPLAIYVSDSSGNIISDVVANLGLPFGRHVGFRIIFRQV